MVFFISPGPLTGIAGVNVRELKPETQRVQLLKSQLPDPEFPKDTYTFTVNVKNVCKYSLVSVLVHQLSYMRR